MSVRALTWAVESARCPSASCKLVLIVYANFANERDWSYPSTDTVCRLSGLNPKTARGAIDALERCGLLTDTGKRAGRTQQVKVYQLTIGSHPKLGGFSDDQLRNTPSAEQEAATAPPSTTPPKTGALKATDFSRKDYRNREAEPSTGTLPPDDPSGSSRPLRGGRQRGSRIPEDWAPPPIAELPPKARAVAEQWPSGAYEVEAEAHRSYWRGESSTKALKLDWTATWCNRIVATSAKPLRDAKAGVRFVPAAPASVPAPRLDHSEEPAAAAEIRSVLRTQLGEQPYARWLDPTVFSVANGRMTIICQSVFVREWLEQHYSAELSRAAADQLGDSSVVWRVDPEAVRGRAIAA